MPRPSCLTRIHPDDVVWPSEVFIQHAPSDFRDFYSLELWHSKRWIIKLNPEREVPDESQNKGS